jgi:iron(III) transport system permease protein
LRGSGNKAVLGAGGRWARGRRPSAQTAIVGAVLIVLGYLTITPLFFLLRRTFTGDDGFSLDGFRSAYEPGSGAGDLMVNSLIFAAGSSLIALTAGTVLAYFMVRTDAPLKPLFFAASLGPLIIPGSLYAVSWIFLADENVGLLNEALAVPILGRPVFDVFGLAGMIWVQGLHDAPIAFLLMQAVLRGMDPSLEESAWMSGASTRQTLRLVTLPLMRPGIVAVVLVIFVSALEGFEIPALLGLQKGIFLFTSGIYYTLKTFPPDYEAAGAYSLTLLVVAAIGVLLSQWLLRDARSYQTITGKAFRPRQVALERWRKWVAAGIVFYFTLAVLLPVLVLLWGSLLPFYQAPSIDAVDELTLENYRYVLTLPKFGTAARNSLLLGVGAATVTMFITAVAAWVVVRTRARARPLVDLLVFAPLVIPGLVLGVSLLFVYLRVPLPIYGTLLILLIAYVTKYLPYGMRYSTTALTQTSRELEESAIVSGASWWQTFRMVLMPLASTGILAGWIYILIVSVRELSSSLLLYSPGNETMGILIWQVFQDGGFTTVATIGVLLVAALIVLVGIAYRLGARVGVGSDDSR